MNGITALEDARNRQGIKGLARLSNRAGMKQKLDELEAFLAEQTTEVTEYDEGLVRQLIEKITVYDDHLAFGFKSGRETEVQM